jgi:hypothetical protein
MVLIDDAGRAIRMRNARTTGEESKTAAQAASPERQQRPKRGSGPKEADVRSNLEAAI